jgi:hypothetical protein
MDLRTPDDSESRFSGYVERLTSVIGQGGFGRPAPQKEAPAWS